MNEEYYLDGRVLSLVKCREKLYGVVAGRAIYRTIVDLNLNRGDCTCPVEFNCKHVKALRYAFEKGDYIEVDSMLKAILSLLTIIIPEGISNIDFKKLFRYYTVKAKCFVEDYMENYGYANLIEASGIVYSLTLLAETLGKDVKNVREQILDLLELSISMMESRYDLASPYYSVEMLWDIILKNFNINEFNEDEIRQIRRLYSRSIDVIEENKEFFIKTKEFLMRHKFKLELKEEDYFTLYANLLRLEGFNWGIEKFIDFYRVCTITGELRCLYISLTLMALITSNFPLSNGDPREKLISLIFSTADRNPKVGELLKEDLIKMGFELRDQESIIKFFVKYLVFEEAYNLIDNALTQRNFEKALFYAVWMNIKDTYKLAKAFEKRNPLIATILYLRSSYPNELVRDELINLFKIHPRTVECALIAFFQRELNFKETIKYIWVVESLEKIEKMVEREPDLKSHYIRLLRRLILLNRRKKKFLRLLSKRTSLTKNILKLNGFPIKR